MRLSATYDNVVNELSQNEWLDLYIPHIDVKEYVGIERTEDAERTVIETAKRSVGIISQSSKSANAGCYIIHIEQSGK